MRKRERNVEICRYNIIILYGRLKVVADNNNTEKIG